MSVFKKLFGSRQTSEPPEFVAVLEGSMESLKFLMANHQATWHIDQADRWDVNQDVGDLVFTFPDGIVKAPAQIIGSFDTTTSMWLWAWANPSVAEPLMRDALRVLEYGRQHGLARLTTAEWKAEEKDGWYMAALANTLCSRNGAYRGPAGTSFVFITFGEVTGSLHNGKLKIDWGAPEVFIEETKQTFKWSALDFSHVTSEEAAVKLAWHGKLFKMLLMPKALSGAEIPENIVYVPPNVLDIQEEIIKTIIPLIQKGSGVHFTCRPEYKGKSFIPAKIHYKASQPETNWHFERTIEIW